MTQEIVDKAKASLERVQKFDTATLPRDAELGRDLNFNEAVLPANRVINLFKQLPLEYLEEIPDNHLQQITSHADSFYNLLSQISTFSARQNDAFNARTSLISSVTNVYPQVFDGLYHYIAFGITRQRDFSALERDYRSSMQRAEDQATALVAKLADEQQDAQRILEEVRSTAAEQGVSQQASYFKAESDSHEAESVTWQNRTFWVAFALGVYAFVSAFAHKLPWLAPTDSYQAFQLGLSKVLIFAVLAYTLFLCARNFLSHKHNAIVNKHRQNALLTFKALVDAAGTEERRDVILTYAAACIFSPQDTGYTKAGTATQAEVPLSIIQSLPKMATGGQ
jgi:hypothetical protein